MKIKLIKLDELIKVLILFAIFVSPIGAQAFCISTPVGEISLFRGSLVLAALLYVLGEKGKISLAFPQSVNAGIRFSVILLAYSLLSFFWALNVKDWFRNVFFVVMAFIVTIMITISFNEDRDIILAMKAFAWGIFIQCGIGWYEIFTGQVGAVGCAFPRCLQASGFRH